MPNTVGVSLDTLYGLAEIARRNGTTSAFIDIALQWASAADAEIRRLRQLLEEKEGAEAPSTDHSE